MDILVVLAIASMGGALLWAFKSVPPLETPSTFGMFAERLPAPKVSVSSGGLPRGIRNKNPGNLRYYKSIPWRGQLGADDAGYAVFDSFENGIRAAAIDLRTGWTRDGEDTVREIISEWAPHSENPTTRYIDFIASRLNVSPDTPLPLSMLPECLRLIFWFENGEPIDKWVTPSQFSTGVQLGMKV